MEMVEEKFIVSSNLGGISNRLKCLVSLWRLSDKYDRKLLVYWPRNHDCGAEFHNLFENKFKFLNKEEFYKIKRKDFVYHTCEDTASIKNSKHKYILSSTCRWIFLPEEIKKGFSIEYPTKKRDNIDLEYDRIPKSPQKEILTYLKRIKPTKKIRDKIEEFSEKNKIEDCFGIHVRRRDHVHRRDFVGEISSDDKFFKKIKEILKENPKARFLLCTDSEETEKGYIKEFGKKIIVFQKTNKNNRDRTNRAETQEGLIDLFLLSKTKHILGTFYSTFTEMAWWLGGCNSKVEIMATESEKKKVKENREKIERDPLAFIKKLILRILGKKPPFMPNSLRHYNSIKK